MKQVTDYIFRGPKDINNYHYQMNGIVRTLDLESGTQVIRDDLPLQEAIEGDLCGIRVYSHPLGAIFPPSIKELNIAAYFLSSKIRTYVHCKHGVDRTGMIIAAYRIINQGWKPIAAAKEAIREGMHWVYIPWLIQLWRLK